MFSPKFQKAIVKLMVFIFICSVFLVYTITRVAPPEWDFAILVSIVMMSLLFSWFFCRWLEFGDQEQRIQEKGSDTYDTVQGSDTYDTVHGDKTLREGTTTTKSG